MKDESAFPGREELPTAARRVADALAEAGHEGEVRLMPTSTRTAADAAATLAVEQRQIIKSLVFRGRSSDQPVLALVDGTSRVNAVRLGNEVGEQVARPNAEWVRQRTGFGIGGVPPVGHDHSFLVVVDARLTPLNSLWAAAGMPHAVFPVDGSQLVRLTGGRIARIAEVG